MTIWASGFLRGARFVPTSATTTGNACAFAFAFAFGSAFAFAFAFGSAFAFGCAFALALLSLSVVLPSSPLVFLGDL